MPEQTDRPVIGPPLKITLVSTVSDAVPQDSNNLAQQNSQGEEDATAALPLMAQTLKQTQSQSAESLNEDDEAMDVAFSQTKIDQTESSGTKDETLSSLDRELLADSINLAYLNAQAKPREKYVSAKAKESIYAAYIEKWRLLVERVGNLNYPEIAKQQRLEGTLVLDVAIKSNGEIDKVRILQSSAIKVLDDAAERIVHIASPFDRFPEQIQKELDILHIVRTWQFSHDGNLPQKLNLQ